MTIRHAPRGSPTRMTRTSSMSTGVASNIRSCSARGHRSRCGASRDHGPDRECGSRHQPSAGSQSGHARGMTRPIGVKPEGSKVDRMAAQSAKIEQHETGKPLHIKGLLRILIPPFPGSNPGAPAILRPSENAGFLPSRTSRTKRPSRYGTVTWIVLANIPNSISSLIVSTRIFSSIVFGRANRALLAEAHSDGGGGCIACDRNEEEECFSTHL